MSTQELSTIRTPDGDSAVSPASSAQHPVDARHRLRGRRPSTALAAALAAALVALPAFAKNHYDRNNGLGNQVIVRTTPEDAGHVAAQYGLELAGEIDNADGYAALLEAPASLTGDQVEDMLRGDGRIRSLSHVELASLPSATNIDLAVDGVAVDMSKEGHFSTPCLSEGFSALLWSGYADQEAARDVRLHEAHQANGDCGSAVVAIIDTGVDADHPLLQGALVPGFDFRNDVVGLASEWEGLDPETRINIDASTASILENQIQFQSQSEIVPLGSSFVLFTQASTASILEEDAPPPFFGHGSMTAGLVRLAAPTAKIMPLRAFDQSGVAHLFDVIRAIYYAVDNGADVVSMSFSMANHSTEMMRAIQYARSRGVILVAAAGNQAEHTLVYPAAFPDTLSVASLDGDELAPFSNYGSQLVDVAAPGTGIVSAYPGGLYGAGWGTSFSAPLVAGTMALLVHRYPVRDIAALQHMQNVLRQGSETVEDLIPYIGSGKLDVLGTVLESQK